MYIVVMIIHIIVCFILIAVILLQAGRGAGLADVFSGSNPLSGMLGTKAASFLSKATTVSAIVFLITCSSLILLSKTRTGSIAVKYAPREEARPVSATTEELPVFPDAESGPLGLPVSEDDFEPMPLPEPETAAMPEPEPGTAAGSAVESEPPSVPVGAATDADAPPVQNQ
ncbi:MAG: preprotein translocase subunit SecG [Candidatus Omnitrophica bacterium]|nr:preprotein translocase subunit SecG [Candidatus Omnitrophota bacterium]